MSDRNRNAEIAWESPSNIAFVKYWGKRANQIPCNPSVSMTLKNALTRTKLKYVPSNSGMQVDFKLAGQHKADFEARIFKFMQSLYTDFPFLQDYAFQIESENTFPHSTGIASSAAAMSALALCLVSMEEMVLNKKLEEDEFLHRASYLARLGSGSASRSLYGGYAVWGQSSAFSKSSDEYAVPFSKYLHPVFNNYQDFILLVSSEKKKVSSTAGHKLMENHPYASARFAQANHNFERMLGILRSGNLEDFSELLENEALSLHGLMMNSTPSYTLLQPNTLSIIEKVRDFRKSLQCPLAFTLDAGPNVHLLFPKSEYQRVKNFVDSELIGYLEQGHYIEDETGDGPKALKSF